MASLVKNPPKAMAEMLLKAQKYMNAEDVVAAIRDVEKSGDKGRKDGERRGQKRECPDHRITDINRRNDDKGTRTVKFTLLLMPVKKILMRIKDKHYLKWPRPLTHHPTFMIRTSIVVFTRIRPLHRRLLGLKGADRRIDTKREITEIRKEWGVQ